MHIQQPFDQPYLHIDVDRTRAEQIGFTQRDIATNLLVSLSGSFQTTPEFWLNPKSGVSYMIATQTPQYRLDSLQNLENIPVSGPSGAKPEILASLASIHRGSGMGLVSHYDIQPLLDIYGSVQGRDLGGVATDIEKIVKDSQKDLPRGTQLIIRGQILTMHSAYFGLLGGLSFSIILVYLLIVVNFQSWLDPFIIISALDVYKRQSLFGLAGDPHCPAQFSCVERVWQTAVRRPGRPLTGIRGEAGLVAGGLSRLA